MWQAAAPALRRCVSLPAPLLWQVLPKLSLSSNKKDVPAAQPEHFGKFDGRAARYKALPLRVEQQRSLAWMLAQEADDTPPFTEHEVCTNASRQRRICHAPTPTPTLTPTLRSSTNYL